MFDHSGIYAGETESAIEKYITVAITNAREVYTDPEWVFWADNWLTGRDRSYESANRAHRRARTEDDREKALRAGAEPSGWDAEWHASKIEAGSEMAVWAAGLALVTAPLAPDLTGAFLRFEATLQGKLSRFLAGRQGWQPRAFGESIGAYVRRLAVQFVPLRIFTARHAHP